MTTHRFFSGEALRSGVAGGFSFRNKDGRSNDLFISLHVCLRRPGGLRDSRFQQAFSMMGESR